MPLPTYMYVYHTIAVTSHNSNTLITNTIMLYVQDRCIETFDFWHCDVIQWDFVMNALCTRPMHWNIRFLTLWCRSMRLCDEEAATTLHGQGYHRVIQRNLKGQQSKVPSCSANSFQISSTAKERLTSSQFWLCKSFIDTNSFLMELCMNACQQW